jgi:mannan endo-1,4-beta-mannosidase
VPASPTWRLPAVIGAVALAVSFAFPSPANAAPKPAAATPAGATIRAAGATLTRAGQPYRFVGVDAYELATAWGNNAGCGAMVSDAQMAAFFRSLPAGAVVRFQAFQETTGTNPATGAADWVGLDRVFAAATAAGVGVIPVLGGQGSGCDGGHWENAAWYAGGYTEIYNRPSNSDGRGLQPLSYQSWVTAVVNRYRTSPALAMWEPMGEAEASACPIGTGPNCSGHQTCDHEAAAIAALTQFFTAIGGLIHRLDPAHLVEAGLLGGGQCGTQGGDYQKVVAGPGIDVASYHDHYGSAPLGGDQWNGIAVRTAQARAVHKPIIAGEIGITAGVGAAGCESLEQRVADMAAKFTAQFAAGSAGEMIWNWSPDPLGPCSFNTTAGDPLVTWLATSAA